MGFIDVRIGGYHKREQRRDMLRVRFPLPIVVAVPRNDRRVFGGLRNGAASHLILAAGLVENQIVSAGADGANKLLAALGGADLLSRLQVIEMIDLMAQTLQRQGKLKIHRLDRVRLSVVGSAYDAEYSHDSVFLTRPSSGPAHDTQNGAIRSIQDPPPTVGAAPSARLQPPPVRRRAWRRRRSAWPDRGRGASPGRDTQKNSRSLPDRESRIRVSPDARDRNIG